MVRKDGTYGEEEGAKRLAVSEGVSEERRRSAVRSEGVRWVSE